MDAMDAGVGADPEAAFRFPPETVTEPRYVAMHEAAHAVAAVILCVPFSTVTVEPTKEEGLQGYLQTEGPVGRRLTGRVKIARRLAVTWAGIETSRRVTRKFYTPEELGIVSDVLDFEGILRLLPEHDQARARALAVARAIVIVHLWAWAIRAVADALVQRTTLRRRDVMHLLDEGWPNKRRGFMRRRRAEVAHVCAAIELQTQVEQAR